MQVSLTTTQVELLKQMRSFANQTLLNTTFKSMVQSIKAQYGIPDKHKVKTKSNDINNPDYAVIVRKKDGKAYEISADGKWTGATRTPSIQKRWFKVDLSAGLDATVAAANNNWSTGQTVLPAGHKVSDKIIGTHRVVGLTDSQDVTFYVEVSKQQ